MISKANNNSDAKELYKGRARFEELVDKAQQIDLWKEIPLYGKVDTTGTSVLVNESNLSLFSAGSQDVHALIDFAADAFLAIKAEYDSFSNRGLLNHKSLFGLKLTPSLGWISANIGYSSYITEYYNTMMESYLSQNGTNNNLIDYRSFLAGVESYILEKGLPFTRHGFHESSFNHSLTSGLSIELKTIAEVTDPIREEWFNDPNFIFFKNLCVRHGFKVNRGLPWRITFDIRSNFASKYIKERNKEISSDYISALEYIFENYYQDLLTNKIFEEFKLLLERSYDVFRYQYPLYGENKKRLNDKEVFVDLDYLELYGRIRNQERKVEVVNKKEIRSVYKASKIENKASKVNKKVLEYIELKTGTIGYRRKTANLINLQRSKI